MVTINGKVKNNLEEQVQRLTEVVQGFQEGEKTIAEFGIKVIGILDEETDIPEQGVDYGDAYLIGNSDPYELFVWTRKEYTAGEWVNIGVFPNPGPQGNTGARGSVINIGSTDPVNSAREDDYYINTTTHYLWRYHNGLWEQLFSMKGSTGERGIQGHQGVKGEKGDPLTFSDLTPQQKEELRGQKGDKGDPVPAFHYAGTYPTREAFIQAGIIPNASKYQAGEAYLVGGYGAQENLDHTFGIMKQGNNYVWYDFGDFRGQKGDAGIGFNTLSHISAGNEPYIYHGASTESIILEANTTFATDTEQFTAITDFNLPLMGEDGIIVDIAEDNQKVIIKDDLSTASEGLVNIKCKDSDGDISEITAGSIIDGVFPDIPIYDNGCLATNTPTRAKDCVNKKFFEDHQLTAGEGIKIENGVIKFTTPTIIREDLSNYDLASPKVIYTIPTGKKFIGATINLQTELCTAATVFYLRMRLKKPNGSYFYTPSVKYTPATDGSRIGSVTVRKDDMGLWYAEGNITQGTNSATSTGAGTDKMVNGAWSTSANAQARTYLMPTFANELTGLEDVTEVAMLCTASATGTTGSTAEDITQGILLSSILTY